MPNRVRPRVAAAVAAVAALMTACSDGTESGSPTPNQSPATIASPEPALPEAPGIRTVELSDPVDHVHGLVAVGADRVVAGTHSGAKLISADGSVAAQGDDRDDLMGMTGTAGTGNLVSSGHPGPGSDLPDPVGLLTSDDAGVTWEPVSLQGQVDFHALTASGQDVIGYGGGETLMVSSDAGRTWEAGAPVQPASLAFSGPRVLATTQRGLMASTDGGRTFRAVKGAPLLVLVSAGTDRTVLGLDPQMRVWHSTDAGRNWTKVGQAPRAQAIAAHENGSGFAIAEDTLYLIG